LLFLGSTGRAGDGSDEEEEGEEEGEEEDYMDDVPDFLDSDADELVAEEWAQRLAACADKEDEVEDAEAGHRGNNELRGGGEEEEEDEEREYEQSEDEEELYDVDDYERLKNGRIDGDEEEEEDDGEDDDDDDNDDDDDAGEEELDDQQETRKATYLKPSEGVFTPVHIFVASSQSIRPTYHHVIFLFAR